MQFHIDSAFLTDIARSWFWNEKMPYKKSEELLMCCLNTDKLSLEEKKAICKDVIEGRKKFVGIDESMLSWRLSSPSTVSISILRFRLQKSGLRKCKS
jgi:hypothetical protein